MTADPADLLRRLPAAGFVPPEADTPWSAAARAAAFTAAVEAFAAAFWSLAPDRRRARYDELMRDARGPAAARLGELEPGLHHEPLEQDDRRAADLTAAVCAMFILPRAARGRRRAEWLTGTTADEPAWRAAARVVARTDPATHDLDPGTFAKLTEFRLADVVARPRPAPAAAPAPRGDRWRRAAALAFGAGVVVVVLALLLVRVRPWEAEPARRFSEAEVAAYLDHRDDLARGTAGDAPPGYYDWLRAGRPAPFRAAAPPPGWPTARSTRRSPR